MYTVDTHVIRLFISGDDADCLDEWMTRIVDASLNTLIQCHAVYGNLVSKLAINL